MPYFCCTVFILVRAAFLAFTQTLIRKSSKIAKNTNDLFSVKKVTISNKQLIFDEKCRGENWKTKTSACHQVLK